MVQPRKYDRTAELELPDPKLQAQATVGGGSTYVVYRHFIWGLDYVDEQVCQVEPEGYPEGSDLYAFVLQDANYNVVALITPDYGSSVEYNYNPYGDWLSATNVGTEDCCSPEYECCQDPGVCPGATLLTMTVRVATLGNP